MSIFKSDFSGSLVVSELQNSPTVYIKKSTNETRGVAWQAIKLEHNLTLPTTLAAIADVKLHATIVPKAGQQTAFKQWFDKKGSPVAVETAEQAEFRQWKASKAAQAASQGAVSAPSTPAVGLPGLPNLGQQAASQEARMAWAARSAHIMATKHYEGMSAAHQAAVTSWLGEFEALVQGGSLSDVQAILAINEALPSMGFKAKIK